MASEKVDVVRLAQERFKLEQSRPKVTPEELTGFTFNNEDDIFIPCHESSHTSRRRLLDEFRDRGFIQITMPSYLQHSIMSLEAHVAQTLACLSEEGKKSLSKAFTKAAYWMRTNFSYAFLKAPGKETWKIRGLNTTETVQIHPFDGLERFLELSYQIIAGFHRLTHAVFHDLAHSLPTEVRDYLLAVVESALESDPSFPFSFSHINVLRYFDPAKDMPVNEHTDAYLFTAIALNTASPSLEAFDARRRVWCPVEKEAAQAGVAPYSRAILMIGESLSRLTNDYFVATLHRVTRLSTPTRFSVPFFLSARGSTRLLSIEEIAALSHLPERPLIEDASDIIGNFLWEMTKRANSSPSTTHAIEARLAHSRAQHKES